MKILRIILRTLQALFILWIFAYTFEHIQEHESSSGYVSCTISNTFKAPKERVVCPKAKKRDPKDIIRIRDLFQKRESAIEIYEHDAQSANLIT